MATLKDVQLELTEDGKVVHSASLLDLLMNTACHLMGPNRDAPLTPELIFRTSGGVPLGIVQFIEYVEAPLRKLIRLRGKRNHRKAYFKQWVTR